MTRRQVLAQFSVPFFPSLLAPSGNAASIPVKIIPEPHLLSTESAAGFKSCLPQIVLSGHPVIVLPGAKQVSAQQARALREDVSNGSLLIWESGLAFANPIEIEEQKQVLAETFGIQLGSPIAESVGSHPYVSFTGARDCLVRPFGLVFSIRSTQSEYIAHWHGIPVAMRKQIGKGNLVYLGAMLGPSLLASDREAHQAATRLFDEIRPSNRNAASALNAIRPDVRLQRLGNEDTPIGLLKIFDNRNPGAANR